MLKQVQHEAGLERCAGEFLRPTTLQGHPESLFMDRQAIQERFGIIGGSQAIHNVIDRLRLVARTDINVLIQGESGVGKELFANAIHEMSARKHGPLVIVNCGAIPEGLIESELFGAEKGAYTGSVERRIGYFEEADGGTIFLDEIGELPLAAQVRLLRVLETGQFSRVGSSTTRTTDARVIAATNRDLAREVEARRFREDLYYRLSTVVLNVPPLRERREDILPIFEVYLHRFVQKYNSPGKRLDESARQLLLHYHWPGNVRELRNVAEQCVVLHRGNTLTADDIRPFLRGVGRGRPGELIPVGRLEQGDVAADGRERELIYRALLELRHEVRDLREQIGSLASGGVIPVHREAVERARVPEEPGRYVIVREADRDDYAPLIEDVPFEIENEEEATFTNGQTEEPRPVIEENELPTLEQAERQLIAEALRRFEGNRRQTAKTLGISERTLYRKLKEYDLES